MPAERGGRLVRVAIAAAGVALVAGACAGTTPARTPGPSFSPSGRLLLESGRFRQRLTAYTLPQGPAQEVPLVAGFLVGARWGSDGAIYMLVQYGFGQPFAALYRLQPDGRPRRLGGVVRGGSGFAFGDHTAVTWDCPFGKGQVLAMDVTAERHEWKGVAEGCGAGVSPDGERIAFARGSSIWQVPATGGRPTRLLSLRTVPGLPARQIESGLEGSSGVALGRDAVAAIAGSRRSGWFVVIGRTGHAPQVVPLGNNVPAGLAWQPGGHLLAFGDFIEASQVSEVRVFDPRTGAITQLAATQTYGQFIWAPDGRVVAVVRSASVVGFVDARANQVGTLSVAGVLDDWTG